MIISKNYKLLYVHIPKTGGTTIQNYIKEADPEALIISHSPLLKEMANKYNDYEKTVIVRNSWQMCVSCYAWECINRNSAVYDHKVNSFKEWLTIQRNNIQKGKHPRRHYYPKQLPFFSDNGEIFVDNIIDFNYLSTELKNLCSKLDVTYSEGLKFKKSKYNDWKSFYNETTYNLVYDMCEDDIKYFDWKY